MKLLLLFIILFCIPLTLAQVENYNAQSSLVLDFNLHSLITVKNPEKMDYLITELLLVPQNTDTQKVIHHNVQSIPDAEITDRNTITYSWEEQSERYEFSLASEVETKNTLYKIQSHPFPLEEIPQEIQRYTQPTEFIDVNEKIIAKSSELTSGETDEFEAVFKIAEWTKSNVHYDLNTLTAQVVKPSTWVFDNREGVCDEITNLFISLLRASGIPARFVTGMVYTNTDYHFGNHGWAEVYFPEQGWIPYDITFGQYAYLDPSHLKLMDSEDSGTSAARYNWKGTEDIQVEPQELDIVTTVKEIGASLESPFSISIKPYEPQVGSSSYVPLEVKITNPYDAYISTTLTITKSPTLTENNVKHILLKPKQEKSVFWIAKINADLDPSLIYTSTIEVKDFFEKKAFSNIEYASSYPSITEQQAKDIVQSHAEIDEKTYSKNLAVSCITKTYYYSYETATIACSLRNTGNTKLDDLQICLEQECQKASLFLNEEKEINFSLVLSNQKSRQLIINTAGNDLDINAYVPLKVYVQPDLQVNFLNAPSELSYKEEYVLKTTLSSQVLIKNLKMQIRDAVYEQKQLKGIQTIEAKIKAKSFYKKPLTLLLTYEDENGRPYSLERNVSISIENVPWYIKFFHIFD